MGLPKQNLPIFPVTIPSTGKLTSFRQFTVREEKALAQAKQSDDTKVITNAIVEVVNACVKDIDARTLTMFDLEYLVTQIRAKAVGEIIDLYMPCEANPEHEDIIVRVNLEDIKVAFPEGHKRDIPLYEDVGVVMRYPTVDSIMQRGEMQGIDLFASCVESIYTEDEVFDHKDQTHEQIVEFLEGLTKTQLNQIYQGFFQTMPRYEYTLKYACQTCGHEHSKLVKGLQGFFE